MGNRNIRKYSRKLVYSTPYFLTTKQAKVINVILDDKDKYNNEELMQDAINVVPLVDKSNVNFVLKLLTDKKLKKAGFDLGASVIISNRIADDPEEASKCRDIFVDKFLDTKLLNENENLNKSLTGVLSETNEKNFEPRKFVMDKYKNSEELQNSKFAQKLGSTLIFTNDNSLEVIDKVTNDEELYNNSNVVDNLPSIFQRAKNPEDMDIINKILEKEEFINDKQTMENVPDLMRILNWNTDDAHDNRCKVLNKVLDDKNLYGNKSLMSKMPDILSDVYYDE